MKLKVSCGNLHEKYLKIILQIMFENCLFIWNCVTIRIGFWYVLFNVWQRKKITKGKIYKWCCGLSITWLRVSEIKGIWVGIHSYIQITKLIGKD